MNLDWLEHYGAITAVAASVCSLVQWVWHRPVSRAVRQIVAEFKPNSGSTLRDSVNRIEDQVAILHDAQRHSVDDTESMVLEALPSGHVVRASARLVQFSGLDSSALLGNGWLLLIDESFRTPAMAAWEAFVRNGMPLDIHSVIRGSTTAERWRAQISARVVYSPKRKDDEQPRVVHRVVTIIPTNPLREDA